MRDEILDFRMSASAFEPANVAFFFHFKTIHDSSPAYRSLFVHMEYRDVQYHIVPVSLVESREFFDFSRFDGKQVVRV